MSQTPLVDLAADGTQLIRIPGVARYLILPDGQKIVVDPEADAGSVDVRLFLLTSCLAAVMDRRGALVLPGAAVVDEGRVTVILGRAVVGHSSLVATLLRVKPSLTFLSAEVCVLQKQGDQVLVLPTYPDLMLPDRVLELFGLWPDSLQPTRTGGTRRHVVREDRFQKTALPLDRIILTEGVSVITPKGIEPVRRGGCLSPTLVSSVRYALTEVADPALTLPGLIDRFMGDGRVVSLQFPKAAGDAAHLLQHTTRSVLSVLASMERASA